jgi:hypothetical protein
MKVPLQIKAMFSVFCAKSASHIITEGHLAQKFAKHLCKPALCHTLIRPVKIAATIAFPIESLTHSFVTSFSIMLTIYVSLNV